MPLLGIEPGPPQREASTFAKSYSNSVILAIRTITYEPAVWPPPMHLVTWTYMNTHELHCSPLASRSVLNIDIRHLQVRIFTVKQDISHKGHQCGDTWPRSSPSITWGPETDMSWPGNKPGPSAVGGEHSSKELFEQRVNNYSEHVHMSLWQ